MKDFVKGRTADEKFKSINTTLRHFSRRLSHKVVGLIPATPVIRFVVPGEDGVILKMICPANGRITQGCVYIESNEKLILVGLQLKRGSAATSVTEETSHKIKTNKPLPFGFNVEVRLGDMITLWVDEPEVDGHRVSRVRGVWLGFLYEISPEGLGSKEFMLEQLEKMEEEDALPA